MKASSNQQQHELVSIANGQFDTRQLQKELAQALEDDRKYKLTDDMKKRAIHTAASYDEFKNLVACADLKPVSQKEIRNFTSMGHSNNLTYKQPPKRAISMPSSSCATSNKTLFKASPSLDKPPKNAIEFTRNWRRHLHHSPQAKYNYLEVTGCASFRSMFKTEMDADLIIDIVQVLLERFKNSWQDPTSSQSPSPRHQAQFAWDLLQAISSTGRFSLNMEFLDNNQRQMLQELFTIIDDQLDFRSSAADPWNALKRKFKLA